jgi:hypothetical protein
MVNILEVLTSDRPIGEIVAIFQREFTAVLREALSRRARAWEDLPALGQGGACWGAPV